MSATKNPNVGLPTNAPVHEKVWELGAGETETKEWGGIPADILAKYNILKGEAEAGGNIGRIHYRNQEGRARLIVAYGRVTAEGRYGNTVTTIEELYAVDIIRDIRCAPYFTTAAATKLTDDQISAVSKAVSLQQAEAEIPGWGAWAASQKQLRYHMLHGMESYPETAFVLRNSLYGVLTSAIKVSFTGINTVVTAPTLSAQMNKLIESLPSGEWLYKSPQCEHLGRGKWRITKEWHWAEKWSKILGGTWGL